MIFLYGFGQQNPEETVKYPGFSTLAVVVRFSSDIRELSDIDLVNRYKETGENICVGELFQRYTHLVFGVCMKYLRDEDESKDMLSHIFEKLLDDLKKHEVAQFKGWLYSVTRNHCLMHLRSAKTKRLRNNELKKDSLAVMEKEYEPHLSTAEQKERTLTELEEAIKQLNDDQRICVELFYLQEKCYKEIAEMTGYNLNQVKSYIQNGKRNLKILLTAKNAVGE